MKFRLFYFKAIISQEIHELATCIHILYFIEFVLLRAAVRALVSLAVLLRFTYLIVCDYCTFMGK